MRLLLAAVLTLPMLVSAPAGAGPALLVDADDGRVLYAEDIDNQWHPASLTKIMTAYLVFEAIEHGKLKLGQVIPCSANAVKQPPSKVGLKVGGGLTVETALQALIIKSANDVAVMLAEAVAGSEEAFVAQMNATARRLGMTRTVFVNPNGLPAPGQISTARDLAKLARAINKDFPGYAAYWAMPSVQVGKARLGSHNDLLKSFEGADGMKTGFICDSGYNIVASATRDGRKLFAVVLGEPSGAARTVRTASLLEYGYQQYGWKTLFNADTIDNMPVAADAKGIVSVRQQVQAWACGYRPPGWEEKQAAKKAKAKAAAAAKAKKAKAAAADAPKKDGVDAPATAAPQKPAAPDRGAAVDMDRGTAAPAAALMAPASEDAAGSAEGGMFMAPLPASAAELTGD